MPNFIFALLVFLYATSFVGLLLTCFDHERSWIKPDVLFELGFLLHTFFIFVEAKEAHVYLPLTTFREVLVFFAWSLAFVYAVLLRRVRQEMFGIILLPFLLSFLLAASLLSGGKAIPLDLVDNHYFLIHILSAFFGYASFTLSFVAGTLYWIQSNALKLKQLGSFYQKLPPLKELEQFIFYSVIWGVFLLGIGIVSGFFWSKSVFQTFSVWEPKTIASILTWLTYGIIFYLHSVSLISGKRSVTFVLSAFGFVLFTLLGTSLFQTRLHVGI